MSHKERTGVRSLVYSKWHRMASTRRYLGPRNAARLTMIDLDDVEYCYSCREPVALIETQASTGQPKEASVMSNLAIRAGTLAYSVSYEPATDITVETADDVDIIGFQVRRLVPDRSEVRRMTPQQYAEWLWSLRQPPHHTCGEGTS